MCSTGNREQGFALLTVLLGLMVLAALVASIGLLAQQQGRHARNLAEAAKAEALADGGVHHAIGSLRRMLQDPAWQGDGPAGVLQFEDGTIEIIVADEAGRVDLNAADEDLLSALLLGIGLDRRAADQIKDAILDWADADDLKRLNGAEAAEYRAARLPPPPNRPFALVDELRLVKGVTPDLARRLLPFVTIHARQRGIDPSVAPPELITLLRGAELKLPPAFVMGSKRQVFAIRAIGRTANGGTFVREAIIRVLRDPTHPPTILAWRQGRL
jgi:general secretion pathway protein K